jgi:hypothetical protein
MVEELRRLGALVSKSQAETAQQQQQISQLTAALPSQPSSSFSSFAPSASVPPSSLFQFKCEPLKPNAFTPGRGVSLDAWLSQMTRYFEASQRPESTWLSIAATYLGAEEGVWWDKVKDSIADWSQFKAALQERHQPLTQAQLVRTRLEGVRQRGTVLAYCTTFLAVVQHAQDMSEPEQLHAFTRGLHPKLRERLEQSDKQITTVRDAMKFVQLVEERRRQYSAYPQQQFSGYSGGPRPYYSQSARSYGGGSSAGDSTSSAPMDMSVSHMQSMDSEEAAYAALWDDQPQASAAAAAASVDTAAVVSQVLNALQSHGPSFRRGGFRKDGPAQRGPQLSEAERNKLFEERKCFRCKEVGHVSRFCPKNRKTTPAQLQQKNQ